MDGKFQYDRRLLIDRLVLLTGINPHFIFTQIDLGKLLQNARLQNSRLDHCAFIHFEGFQIIAIRQGIGDFNINLVHILFCLDEFPLL